MSDGILHQQLQAFADYLAVERNLSPHTASNYRRDCLKLLDWCGKQQLTTLGTVDSQHIRSCLRELHSAGLQSKSLQRWLSSVRTFFRFAIRKGWATDNPALSIAAPKSRRTLANSASR